MLDEPSVLKALKFYWIDDSDQPVVCHANDKYLLLQLDTSSLPQMTECCDAHDLCYDTCNKVRDKCDNDFKMCLEIMCEKLKRDITKNQYEGE